MSPASETSTLFAPIAVPHPIGGAGEADVAAKIDLADDGDPHRFGPGLFAGSRRPVPGGRLVLHEMPPGVGGDQDPAVEDLHQAIVDLDIDCLPGKEATHVIVEGGQADLSVFRPLSG